MIRIALNGMIYMMLAKFIINDLPHAAGLLANPNYGEPPTPGQLRYIAVLCQQLKITTPYEEQVKTFGEAGRLIGELETERKHRRRLGSGNPTVGLFDWSTYTGPKPVIPGYVFHHTYEENALKILEDGYLLPSVGSISFTLDPWFAGIMPSVCFVFEERVIREKYSGREIDYFYIEDPEARRRAWEQEMEIEVKSQRVSMKDCVEVLSGRDANWKYGHGYKYHYKDIRDREYWPWTKFKR